MAYSPELDDEIEDEDDLQDGPAPANTVAGPQTTRDQVMQRIAGVRNPAPAAAPAASNASSFDLGPRPDAPDPAQMQAAQQFSRSSALTSGLGRALNTLAAGTGAKTDNSAYDAIDKQGQNAVAQAQTASDNKQQLVKDWIAGKSKQAENTEARDFKERELQEQIKARLQAAGIAAGAKNETKNDKMAAAMKADLDPNGGRAGNMGFNQKKVDASDRLLQLIEQIKSQPGGADKRQMEELAIGTNSMLSNASTGAASQVAALVPHTLFGGVQDLTEYLTNNPTGKGQMAFVNRIGDTIQREKDVASDQVKGAQVQRLAAHGALQKKDPETYNALLASYGIDPDAIQNGRYVSPSRQKAGGAPAHQDGGLIPSAMAGAPPTFTEEDVQHFKLAKDRLAKNPNDAVAKKALAIAAAKGLQ